MSMMTKPNETANALFKMNGTTKLKKGDKVKVKAASGKETVFVAGKITAVSEGKKGSEFEVKGVGFAKLKGSKQLTTILPSDPGETEGKQMGTVMIEDCVLDTEYSLEPEDGMGTCTRGE